MKRAAHLLRRGRSGSVLILSLIFLIMFSALAVAMAGMSDGNVQIAENHRKLGTTHACAESGLEITRYWLGKIEVSGTTAPGQRFSQVASLLQAELTANDVNNITPAYGETTITIPSVALDSGGQSFSAVLTKIDDDNIRLDVTGRYGPLARTIRANYAFSTRAHTVFDFGVASKGPVSLSGNVDLEGVNIDVESNAYIESENTLLALSITGNSQIAGSVKIVNPSACVYLQGGQAGIGGVTGQAATQPPYTTIGAPPTEFPEMHPQPFINYVEAHGAVVTVEQASQSNTTFTNPIIRANTNPSFASGSILRGVVFVEAPNTVTFAGHVSIAGIIVTDGDPLDDSGTNQLSFSGNVTSYSVETLSAAEFGTWLPTQKGTFIMAPGFLASFTGSFSAESGAIAANGIQFSGNAGGTINGSIINYSDAQMVLSGNSDLYFNRSGLTEVPAGFVPQLILQYDPSSYAEVIL